MWKTARTSLTLMAIASASLVVVACGGTGASSEVVARVGGSAVTKAEVNHWMATLAGGDYFQLSHSHVVPPGLVSDPPNYERCVSRLEVTQARAPATGIKSTGPQLLRKCRQLYQALKAQAVSYLTGARATIGLAREFGLTASNAEVMKLYRRFRAEEFPTDAEQAAYLAKRRLSLADELLVMKLDVLGQKFEQLIKADEKKAVAKMTQGAARWKAKTDCRAGYVVEQCRQYKPAAQTAAANPGASVLIEQVAALATGICVNRPACAEH